ncbi:MAG: SusC/RagA family TonB-linked outer membrane protein [Spirosomataceae bacterium]
MKKTLLVSFLFVCLVGLSALSAVAQIRKVTGKVTSAEDASGMPGVTVQLKGTTKGVNTDLNGTYSIEVPNAGGTLVFSFVGMASQEVAIGSRSVIDVKLSSDTKQLSEVVVTAIGIQREKKGLGYAVSNVGGDLLQQRSESDPLRALSAKVPGVTIVGGGGAPGQATKINIRGFNSLTGNTQPLFVVDGVPFDNSVNGGGSGFAGNTAASNRAYDLDPNNIESMTVLKGAAAAALYGSRATNGVIVITTKAGSKKARKGLEVTYNSSYSNESISRTPDYQDIYTQGSNQNYNGGFIGNWGAPFPQYVDEINQKYYAGAQRYSKTYSLYRLGPNKGKPYPDGTAEMPYASRYDLASMGLNQWVDEYGNGIPIQLRAADIIGGFFRNGQLVENAINISSTGDKTSLNAGASRMTNSGIVDNQKTSRTTLNFGGNAQLANGLNLSGTVTYVNTAQDTPPTGAGYYTDYGGFGNEGSIFGRIFYLPRNFLLNDYPYENPQDGSMLFYRSGLDNPLWSVKYNTQTSRVNRAYGNMALSYDVLPWLNVLVKGGINTYSENLRRTQRKGSAASALGFIRNENLTFMEQDYNVILTATKDITEAISFRGTFGGNLNYRKTTDSQVTGTDIITNTVLNTASTASQIADFDYYTQQRLYGVYGDIQLGYKNYLFLGVTGRNDWSSTLPANNRSYFYPAGTLSFIFTDALNLKSNILESGKLRLAYGKVGAATSPYRTQTVFPLGIAYKNFSGSTFYNASLSNTLNNANLRPEFKTELEIGTELSFLKNRITLDLTYFNSTSKDLIVNQRIASSTGFSTQVVNAGELNNKGIEASLTLIPVQTKSGFQWTSTFAFTRIRSKVVDAGPAGEIFLGGTGLSTLGTIHRTGEPFGMIYGTKNARDADGNLLINETTGLPFGMATSQILGNPAPNFTLGWTNSFSFKGFTLSALIDYRQGGKMYSATAASLLLRGQLKISENREGLRVVPGVYGDLGTYSAILGADGKAIKNTTGVTAFDYHFSNGFGAYGQDEVNIYDITSIRLREVSLGYSLPKTLLSHTPFGSARISVSGRNLWFYAPNMLEGLGFDPEVLGSFPDSNVQGFDLGAQPTTRRLGVNLSVTF